MALYCSFDVLCHALESYTALSYTERSPRPANPIERPAYQGNNPISDVWSGHALTILRKYFERSVFDQEDREARAKMHLASSFAGASRRVVVCVALPPKASSPLSHFSRHRLRQRRLPPLPRPVLLHRRDGEELQSRALREDPPHHPPRSLRRHHCAVRLQVHRWVGLSKPYCAAVTLRDPLAALRPDVSGSPPGGRKTPGRRGGSSDPGGGRWRETGGRAEGVHDQDEDS